MQKPAIPRTASPPRRAKVECCTEPKCDTGLRNKYFEGKRLTPHMFSVEQRYLVGRRHLLNRAIHGWGVVYGYAIEAESQHEGRKEPMRRRLSVKSGLALDECGRELLQEGALHLDLDDVIVLEGKRPSADRERSFEVAGQSGRKQDRDRSRECWLLSVHYAEQDMGDVLVSDPCRCEHREWDRTCETVRYSLRRVPCAECCHDFSCELACECGSGPCCDAHDTTDDAEARTEACLPHRRGGCNCLCDHLTNLEVAECGPLCEIEEPCGLVRVDLQHGVPLACVKLVRDDCDDWTFEMEVEACGPRRLVKRNDLLFDLIRGCDLTRISKIGWEYWHRREAAVPFDEFSRALGDEGDREAEYITRAFWVEFSRPVRETTLRPDCFAMTVMIVEREGGWWQTFRVPIVRLDTTVVPPEPGDPANHVRGARIVVDGAWVEDGVRGRRSHFLGDETRVELEVRGDFIVDCNGQTIDANAVGLCPFPTGNGAPGGTFLSSFRVAAAREAPARAAPYDNADRVKGASS